MTASAHIAPALAAWLCAAPGEADRALDAAADLRALPVAEAAGERPVVLEGVITFAHRATFGTYGFVQDATAGIYVAFPDDGPAPRVGDRVRIDGVTEAGEFAPIVRATRFASLGPSRLPPAPVVSAAALIHGTHDSRWIRVRGQIREVRDDPAAEVETVVLASGEAQVRLDFVGVPPDQLAALWGAVVEVEGVGASIFNERRQLLGLRLLVPGLDHIHVTRPGPDDPLSLPTRPIAAVMSFHAEAPFPGLHRVRGVVSLSERSGAFAVQDDTGGLRVYGASAPPLGATVDVVGFAEPGDLGPTLVAARYWPSAEADPPLTPLRPSELLVSELEGRLVAVEGEVTDRFEDEGMTRLALRLDDSVISARLPGRGPVRLDEAVRVGSRVRATGVLELATDPTVLARSPDRFALAPTRARLLLRSLDDVVLLRGAPWWTPTRVAALLAAMLGVSIVAVLGVVVLRRRVRAQTRIIREQLERELDLRRRAEAANSAKDVFLANISHELRTPMNGVLGYADLLCAAPDLPPEHKQQVAVLRESGQSLLRLLNDLLDFSKIEAGGMSLEARPTPLRPLVDGCLELVRVRAQTKGLELSARVDGRCPEIVNVDGARLNQVLLNLLTNAVKFTEHGSVRVVVEPGAKGLRFAVHDTGIGLSEEEVGRLFRRFSQADASTTRKFGGTGLGLAICKGLVEAMGGNIGAAGEPGRGSEFWFDIPAPSASALASASESGSTSLDRPLRALLVDDNAVNRALGEKMLQRLGHEVDLADGGDAALRRVLDHRYDVVFMDIHMPDMDGLECTRAIRQLLDPEAQPYIVALTADASVADRSACLGAGMNDHLSKPLTLRALKSVLAVVPAGPVDASTGPLPATGDLRPAAEPDAPIV